MKKLTITLLLIFTTIGCTRLEEVRTNGDRIWLLTRGGRHVYRCFDMTPLGSNPAAHATVFCKDADLLERDYRGDSHLSIESSSK